MANLTKTDDFILAQANAGLRSGENIVTWAYLVPPVSTGGGLVGAARTFSNAATMSAVFAVVTDQRLVLVQTRIGAFEPLLENHGVQVLERSAIRGVAVGKTLLIELDTGEMLEYEVKRATKHVSMQGAFFEKLESLLGRSEAARAAGASKNRSNLIATGVGIALAVGYVAFRFLAH